MNFENIFEDHEYVYILFEICVNSVDFKINIINLKTLN